MKILVFGMSGDILGGIERYLLNMNKEFDSLEFGYVIEGSCCIFKDDIEKMKEDLYYVFPKKESIYRNLRDINYLLKKQKDKYSGVYFNIVGAYHFMPFILAKIYGYKVIFHSHNVDTSTPSNFIKLMDNIGRFIIYRLNALRLGCSEKAGKWIFGDKKFIVIRNAIYVEDFAFSEKIRQKRRALLKCEENFIIGFVGRLSNQKNPLRLISVFIEILKYKKESKLLIIGDGELKKSLQVAVSEHHIEDKVILLGNSNDVGEWMQAMDIFVFPTKYEGLGIALIEAQASGLRCFVPEGVIPKEAILTNLIHEEPNVGDEGIWGKDCSKDLYIDRTVYKEKIVAGGYDIHKEAKRLEKIIFKYCIDNR